MNDRLNLPALKFPRRDHRRDDEEEWLVAWLSGNALVSINVVTLRRARLVLGWVTV